MVAIKSKAGNTKTSWSSFKYAASKFSKEWFKNWVWAPKSFNKHARMPQFFAQTNNSKPEFMKKNIAEVNAIAEYIYDNPKPYNAFANTYTR